jgi:hypothetical protein
MMKVCLVNSILKDKPAGFLKLESDYNLKSLGPDLIIKCRHDFHPLLNKNQFYFS